MSDKIRIVYDKQCPACSAYCLLAKAHAEPGQIELIDARDPSDLMAEITRRGMDIDEGMVVEVDGELHYGADGIRRLATVENKKNFFNRVNRILFKNERMARRLYSLLKAVRNILLKLLGIRRINNLERPGKDRF